jgi:hypothetical protein
MIERRDICLGQYILDMMFLEFKTSSIKNKEYVAYTPHYLVRRVMIGLRTLQALWPVLHYTRRCFMSLQIAIQLDFHKD